MRKEKNTQEVRRGSGEAAKVNNGQEVSSGKSRMENSPRRRETQPRESQTTDAERKSKTRGGKGVKAKNKRYWETERAILEAFYGAGEQGVGNLIRKAKIARSTFYNHHENYHQIMPDLERKTLGDYDREVRSALKRNYRTRTLLHQMLVFIRKNRREFTMIANRGDERALEAMIDDLLPKIAEAYHIPKESAAILRVYRKEITGIVETWILGDYRPRETQVLSDMMYLTSTARRRLLPLKH